MNISLEQTFSGSKPFRYNFRPKETSVSILASEFNPTRRRTTEELTTSEKIPELIEVFSHIANLEDDWDADGAPKISRQVINNSLRFYLSIPNAKPKIMPTGSNSILMVFKNANQDLMIEIFDSTYGYAIINHDFTYYVEKCDIELNNDDLKQIFNDFYGIQNVVSKIRL